jgi:hypothetical protein
MNQTTSVEKKISPDLNPTQFLYNSYESKETSVFTSLTYCLLPRLRITLHRRFDQSQDL